MDGLTSVVAGNLKASDIFHAAQDRTWSPTLESVARHSNKEKKCR